MRAYLTIQQENNVDSPTPELRKLLRAAAKQALIATGFNHDAEISLVLTDDAGIRDLNRNYRSIDKATDVLSFAMSEGDDAALPDGVPALLGDIVISRQRAAEQAESYGQSELRETIFLFTHGMLHLLGYDHERGAADEKEMFALQDIIMKKLAL